MLFIKHYLFSIIIEDCGKTEGTGTPWRSKRQRQDTHFTFLLCPGTLLPGSGTEGPVCTDRQGYERTPTEPAQLDTKWVRGRAGKADGGRRQRSLFSVSGPGAVSWMWGGVGWGAMACKVLEQEGELCRQEGMLYRWQCGSLIRTDLKSWWPGGKGLVMWGWNTSGSIAWWDSISSPKAFHLL